MLKTILLLLLTVSSAWAGDPAVGEKMAADKDCAGCHRHLVGGDGGTLYTRSERKVKNRAQLGTQVGVCSAEARTGWFPEDEEHVVAWLNHRYYNFK